MWIRPRTTSFSAKVVEKKEVEDGSKVHHRTFDECEIRPFFCLRERTSDRSQDLELGGSNFADDERPPLDARQKMKLLVAVPG